MKIHFVKNQPNCYYNIDKWRIEECPLLLITGLSGSGKTTYAEKFAKKNNAVLVSFDVMKFYKNSSKESKQIMRFFLEKHPNIKKQIMIHWKKTDKLFSNDILYNYFCNMFFDFLMDYSKEQNKLIILEGIQIFVRLHPEKTSGMPLIVIGSSCLSSHIKKIKRDYSSKHKKINIFINIKDLYEYHLKQCYSLNKYILYYEIVGYFST